ncbi:MAG: TetR/AcrR family transcriptional regulator [Candidatus Binatia bacterium]
MGLREEKKQHQRREIYDTAIALFRERGYDQTRVQDIIARLRISEGTFFNYFPAKDAILHEFALETVDLYDTLLRHEAEVHERSVPDRIRDALRTMAVGIEADREFMAVVFTRSKLLSAEGLIKEKEMRAYDLLADLFRTGQARGEVRDDIRPLQLAEILTGIYSQTMVNWLIGWWKHRDRLEPRMMRAVDVFLDGCRAHRHPKRVRSRGSRAGRRRLT